MFFFAFGIDPLITYLDKRLSGILIMSLPVLGPVPHDSSSISLPPLEERYRVISYADDLKPAITTMEEFTLVNDASALFESASGCKLHRDPASQKCKFLPLGRWRKQLQQEDLPRACQYFVLPDHLDMVGVQLRATWSQHYQPLACWKVHVSHHKTLVCEHLRPIQSVVQVWVS